MRLPMHFSRSLAPAILVLAACAGPQEPSVPGHSQTAPASIGAISYTMIDMGVLPGGTNSLLVRINKNGWALGGSDTAGGLSRAMLYRPDFGIVTLKPLAGDVSSHAHDMNDNGILAGTTQDANGVFHPVRWQKPYTSLPTRLKSLGAPAGQAIGINATGVIVGYSYLTTGYRHAALWSGTTVRDLGTLGGLESVAYAINATSVVVGEAQTVTGEWHAFRWTSAAGMRDLGVLGGNHSQAAGINKNGVIVGANDLGNNVQHPFRWTAATGMVDIGTLGGDYAYAYMSNDSGVMVGYSNLTAGAHVHGWVMSPGGVMTDLGTFGGDYSQAMGINNCGSIVGLATYPSGDYHATMWRKPGCI